MKKRFEVLKLINQRHYDVAINLRGDIRDIIFMRFIDAERKLSHTRTGGSELLTDAVSPDYSNPRSHPIEDMAYLLREAGCKFTDEELFPRLFLSDKAKQENKNFIVENNLTGKILVGIHHVLIL